MSFIDLTDIRNIKFLCQKYNIHPQKSRGQNFLINQGILERIVATAELKKNDVVLEIGPGLGVLTKALAEKVKKVVAVEIDHKLVEILKEEIKGFNNVEIVEDDILQFGRVQEVKPPIGGFTSPYKVVANLPYGITSPVLKKFLSEEPRPTEMTLLVQKEVGEKIIAKPGDTSLLSIMVQFYGEPKIISIVSKGNFWPAPQVDSVILKIANIKPKFNPPSPRLRWTRIDEKIFFHLVKAGFANRRKQLKNNLIHGLGKKEEEITKIFTELKINQKARAQELSVEDWVRLAFALK